MTADGRGRHQSCRGSGRHARRPPETAPWPRIGRRPLERRRLIWRSRSQRPRRRSRRIRYDRASRTIPRRRRTAACLCAWLTRVTTQLSEIVRRCQGSELVGLRYTPPFNYFLGHRRRTSSCTVTSSRRPKAPAGPRRPDSRAREPLGDRHGIFRSSRSGRRQVHPPGGGVRGRSVLEAKADHRPFDGADQECRGQSDGAIRCHDRRHRAVAARTG